jgi:hypothetical protein
MAGRNPGHFCLKAVSFSLAPLLRGEVNTVDAAPIGDGFFAL